MLHSVASAVGSSAASFLADRYSTRENFDLQRRFRQTAYQDTMADMKAAGLNPILAYKTGATGGTAVPLSSQGSAAVNAANNTASSAIALKRQSRELDLLDANITNVLSENEIKQKTVTAMEFQNRIAEASLKSELVKGQFASDHPFMMKLERILSPFNSAMRGANSASGFLQGLKYILPK